jgi:hypothetical protein
MITHFTRVIYPNYREFDYCGNFRGNNNCDNRGIPVYEMIACNFIPNTIILSEK